jgi:hypothetical protein
VLHGMPPPHNVQSPPLPPWLAQVLPQWGPAVLGAVRAGRVVVLDMQSLADTRGGGGLFTWRQPMQSSPFPIELRSLATGLPDEALAQVRTGGCRPLAGGGAFMVLARVSQSCPDHVC